MCHVVLICPGNLALSRLRVLRVFHEKASQEGEVSDVADTCRKRTRLTSGFHSHCQWPSSVGRACWGPSSGLPTSWRIAGCSWRGAIQGTNRSHPRRDVGCRCGRCLRRRRTPPVCSPVPKRSSLSSMQAVRLLDAAAGTVHPFATVSASPPPVCGPRPRWRVSWRCVRRGG